MAGLGYKNFTVGQVLTSAEVDGYLMEQAVMVFASSAARSAALAGVLSEGMLTYLLDTNALEFYDGTAFQAVGASVDDPFTTNFMLMGG